MPFSFKQKKRDDLGEVGNCARPSTRHRFGLWAAAVIHGSGFGSGRRYVWGSTST